MKDTRKSINSLRMTCTVRLAKQNMTFFPDVINIVQCGKDHGDTFFFIYRVLADDAKNEMFEVRDAIFYITKIADSVYIFANRLCLFFINA